MQGSLSRDPASSLRWWILSFCFLQPPEENKAPGELCFHSLCFRCSPPPGWWGSQGTKYQLLLLLYPQARHCFHLLSQSLHRQRARLSQQEQWGRESTDESKAGPKGPHVSLFQALDTATTQVLGRSQKWPLTKDPSFPMGGPGPLTQPYFHHRLEFRWQLCEWSLELRFTSHRQHSE